MGTPRSSTGRFCSRCCSADGRRAVIRSRLVWYRDHGDGDTRHLAMTAEHVLHLLRTIARRCPRDWSDADDRAFFKYSGYWLFELYA